MYVLGSSRQEGIQDGRRLPIEHPQLSVFTAVGYCQGYKRQENGQGQHGWSHNQAQVKTPWRQDGVQERHVRLPAPGHTAPDKPNSRMPGCDARCIEVNGSKVELQRGRIKPRSAP